MLLFVSGFGRRRLFALLNITAVNVFSVCFSSPTSSENQWKELWRKKHRSLNLHVASYLYMSLHSLCCFCIFERDLSSTFSFLTTPPFPRLLIYWWTTTMHFLLHPLYRRISNQIIFFSCPKQRTFLFLLSSPMHATSLPFVLLQFVLLSGYFTFFIIRLHKRIFLKPSLSPPLLSPSFHPPPSQNFCLFNFTPTLPPRCVRRGEVYSFVKPAQVEGGGGQDCRGGGRRRRGGGGGGLLGGIHFQSAIFSFVFLQHFTAI